MTRFFLLFMVLSVIVLPAYAAEDAVDRAMKLYEKRHYEEATALRKDIAALPATRQAAAQLTLGMVYLKNAELYQKLAEGSAQPTQDYLRKLSSGKGKDNSTFAQLYLAQAMIQAGKPEAAVLHLEKFIANDKADARFRAIAKANLALCYFLGNEKQKAESLWNSIDSKDLEVRSELAFAYSKAGLKEKGPETLCEQSVAEVKETGKPVSMRLLKNCISVFATTGSAQKAIELLKGSDLKAYSYREVLGKTKIITFYDPSLPSDLSMLYGKASIVSLEKAAADPNVAAPANYYLGQAYLLFGNAEQSAKSKQSLLAASKSKMPAAYTERARIWLATSDYLHDRKAEAAATWNQVSQKNGDPDVVSEVLFSCGRVKADCSQAAKRAESIVAGNPGKKTALLNIALGSYYLSKKNDAKAVAFLEAGRDKSNKNKIEFNDPLMLVDLAGIYYRNKKFSEALEIYFEMSKQFPVVRQIQEAMQGMYAIEQKSAGDVKIF